MTPLQILACECEDARLAWQADAGNMAKLDVYSALCVRLSHYFIPDILATIPPMALQEAA